MNAKFYLTGGALRDLYLGIKSKDLDFVVVAPSYGVMKQAILDKGGEIFLEKEQYLTIRARLPEVGAADFVLARKDGAYGDHRRPDYVEPGTLLDDLSRRDFTVGAMAKDIETGEIIDPFNGLQDIKENTLRCVGNARERFQEDALRLLRAGRFFITKNLDLHEDIEESLYTCDLIDLLENVSVERVYDEVTKMFRHDTYRTLRFFHNFNYLEHAVFQKISKLWLKPSLEER